MGRAAVFLDRDGVVNCEVQYLSRPDQLELIPGAAEAILHLNLLHIPVIVVTNQAGVARGYFTEEDVERVHIALAEMLCTQGAHIDRFFYCPHHPTQGIDRYRVNCDCRKPKPGLLYRAAEELDLELGQSAMIGDKMSDLEAGQRAGCTTVLVLTGYGCEVYERLSQQSSFPDHVCADLARAVECLLADWSTESGRTQAR
jgi:D-glycero-D-manno-heptose 1,7-bisphosphate phosphatase